MLRTISDIPTISLPSILSLIKTKMNDNNDCLRITLDGHDTFCIERIKGAPIAGVGYSIMFYYIMNGDLMRDPEICVEMVDDKFRAYYFRNDNVNFENEFIRKTSNGYSVSIEEVKGTHEILRDMEHSLNTAGFLGDKAKCEIIG